jgi:hypothetical protein
MYVKYVRTYTGMSFMRRGANGEEKLDMQRKPIHGEIMNQISTPISEPRFQRPRKSSAHQFIGDRGRREDELLRKWPGEL